MNSLPVDPAGLRAAYERQLALLVPVVDGLRDAAIAPSVVAADEWTGPTADAAHDFLRELRSGLRGAADAVDDEVRLLRHRIAELL